MEDEIDFRKVLTEYLTLSGYTVFPANHGKHGLEVFEKNHIDICILDVMMPVMDGYELAEKLRKKDPVIPIIFLTAKNRKEDKLKGLKLGADDYMTKPFEAEELVLRMQNILRRSGKKGAGENYIGNIRIRMDELKMVTSGGEYQLTLREAELLNYLAQHCNQVVTREMILEELWGRNDYFLGRSMDVFISRIRKYIQEEQDLSLETIRGKGFILRKSDVVE